MDELKEAIEKADFLFNTQKEKLLAILSEMKVEGNPVTIVDAKKVESLVDEILRDLLGISIDDLLPLERRRIKEIITKNL